MSPPRRRARAGRTRRRPNCPPPTPRALSLSGGAAKASDVKGAKADGGVYVAGFNQVGAKVHLDRRRHQGSRQLRFYTRYRHPGRGCRRHLVVNGKAETRPLNMKNFGGTPKDDWEKGWQTTWANVNLNEGNEHDRCSRATRATSATPTSTSSGSKEEPGA
ncbi:hypothetical protein GCM10023238_29360 [Streptomyces heliomycini]